MAEKEYGLVKPQKPTTRLLAFASDTDSDDEPTKKKISIGENSNQKRQVRQVLNSAIEEDPTIFQYDEVYDEINAKREMNAKSYVNRESKYISKLLVTAEKRKIEYESRIERKVQRERIAEGDQFKDKEVFVTAAYRQKLETMKKAEEEAQREEYLECIGDVRKQKDLSGFYRHMYEQKNKPTENDEQVPETNKNKKATKRRVYRKHDDHENSDDEDQRTSKTSKPDQSPPGKKVHLQSHLDADSDFSIDSSISENETVENEKDNEREIKISKTPPEIKIPPPEIKIQLPEIKVPPPEIKPKIDIWQKKTVDDIYLAAVKRYYERIRN